MLPSEVSTFGRMTFTVDIFHHSVVSLFLSHGSRRLALGQILPPVLSVKVWLTSVYQKLPIHFFLLSFYLCPCLRQWAGMWLISPGATRWRCFPCHGPEAMHLSPGFSHPSILPQGPGLPADHLIFPWSTFTHIVQVDQGHLQLLSVEISSFCKHREYSELAEIK